VPQLAVLALFSFLPALTCRAFLFRRFAADADLAGLSCSNESGLFQAGLSLWKFS
jgi:hypothetical protein